MKKITILAVVLLLAGSFAVYAGGKKQGAAASAENVTINYVSWMTKGEDIPLLNDFMAANPGIKVVNQTLDGAAYANLLFTMMQGGTVPDVFLCQAPLLPDLVAGGYIQPINGLAGVEKQASNPSVNDLMTINGKVYAYAINGGKGDQFVYYNTLYFAANGFTPPATFAEFDKLCGDIAAKGGVPLAISAGDTWSADYGARHLYTDKVYEKNLAGIASAELALLNGEIKRSDLYGDSFRKLASWYRNGWVSRDALAMGWEQAAQFFVDGGAALFPGGNWVPGSTPVQQSNPSKFKIGAFPVPSQPLSDGKRHVMSSTDRLIVLSAKSAQPAAAKALFEYFIRNDVLVKYLERQGLIGVNVEAKVDPVFDYSFQQFAKSDVVLETRMMNMMPGGYDDMSWQYAADIFTGADVSQLLKKLDEDSDAFIAGLDRSQYINAIKALR